LDEEGFDSASRAFLKELKSRDSSLNEARVKREIGGVRNISSILNDYLELKIAAESRIAFLSTGSGRSPSRNAGTGADRALELVADLVRNYKQLLGRGSRSGSVPSSSNPLLKSVGAGSLHRTAARSPVRPSPSRRRKRQRPHHRDTPKKYNGARTATRLFSSTDLFPSSAAEDDMNLAALIPENSLPPFDAEFASRIAATINEQNLMDPVNRTNMIGVLEENGHIESLLETMMATDSSRHVDSDLEAASPKEVSRPVAKPNAVVTVPANASAAENQSMGANDTKNEKDPKSLLNDVCLDDLLDSIHGKGS